VEIFKPPKLSPTTVAGNEPKDAFEMVNTPGSSLLNAATNVAGTQFKFCSK
jgi:hypothetical protein